MNYEKAKTIREGTQKWKIIKIMLMRPGQRRRPEDFMQYTLGEDFVGYEASARLSELGSIGVVESIKWSAIDASRSPKKNVHRLLPEAREYFHRQIYSSNQEKN